MAYSAWESFQGSSVLSSGRYDASEQKLQLRFASGKHYEYADVPQSFWWGLCQSESKGAFFNTHISSSFQFVHLSGSSARPDVRPSRSKPRRKAPLEEPEPEDADFVELPEAYVPPARSSSSSRTHRPKSRENVFEEDAHELVDAGDFLGAVSIYEQLEEEERDEDSNASPSPELICYYLYNQVVCLCWAGDYVWAARRAGKLADYADKACDGVRSYEFNHSPIDCWVVKPIRAHLEGRAPEPELMLAMEQLRHFHDGVPKPDGQAEAAQRRGCIVILLAIPAGLAGLFLY
jgi:hypothetical protein